jgi:hypothetical protein
MVIRVAVTDVEQAEHLVGGLVTLLGDECVSPEADGEVHVRLQGKSSQRIIVETLNVVERWLDETGLGSVDVWLGERPYRLERPRSVSQVARAV